MPDFNKFSVQIPDKRLSLKYFATMLLFLSSFALLPPTTNAQQEKTITKSVQFAKGKSSAIIRGIAQPYIYYAYTVRAKADQEMEVRLTSSNKNVYFTVFAPGGLGALTGEEEVTNFSEILDKSGIYKIMVFSKADAGNSAYSLKISVTEGEKY